MQWKHWQIFLIVFGFTTFTSK